MYYIRKFGKAFNFSKIKEAQTIEDIDSDVIKQELSTVENTLSFWKCENLDNLTDTLKAIILASSEISKAKFIILDSSYIHDNNLETSDKNKGKTGYVGSTNLHIDICNLTYKKIGKILDIYKTSFSQHNSTCELQREEVKSLIIDVIKDKELDIDKLDERLKKDILKLAEFSGLEVN